MKQQTHDKLNVWRTRKKFRQVQEIKEKEAMFLLHIYSSRAVLSYLTGLFKLRLTHFNLNTKK